MITRLGSFSQNWSPCRHGSPTVAVCQFQLSSLIWLESQVGRGCQLWRHPNFGNKASLASTRKYIKTNLAIKPNKSLLMTRKMKKVLFPARQPEHWQLHRKQEREKHRIFGFEFFLDKKSWSSNKKIRLLLFAKRWKTFRRSQNAPHLSSSVAHGSVGLSVRQLDNQSSRWTGWGWTLAPNIISSSWKGRTPLTFVMRSSTSLGLNGPTSVQLL